MARTSRKQQSSIISTPSVPSVRIWKAAIYVRLSVEDNGKDSNSVENQTLFLKNYVTQHPFLQEEALFVDNGYTGTDFRRPEFTRMMEAVQSGLVDCIVVKDLSRLGRNYIETSQFIEKICPFYGLRFIAVNDSYDTATATSEGQLSVSLSNIVNDYYAKDISRKVRSALNTKIERGDFIGNYAPYGYRRDPVNKNHLVIDPETAPVIQQIFQWRSQGMGYMTINRQLNEAGILSPSQWKVQQGIRTNNNQKTRTILWNRHMITQVLSNVVYIGHMVQRKSSQNLCAGLPAYQTGKDEQILVRNTHEPLISEDLFEKVQAINQAVREQTKANFGKYAHLPKARNIYAKKFTCGCCGARMKLHRSVNQKHDKAYFVFECPTYVEHGNKGCRKLKIRKEDLDAAVLGCIQTQMNVFLDLEQSLQKLLSMKKAQMGSAILQKEITGLQQTLARKQSLLSSLYVDLKNEFVSKEDYSSHRRIITEDIEALKTRLAELEAAQQDSGEALTSEMHWKGLIQKFYESSELSKDMVDAFLDSMVLRKDSTLEIKLSYMDEFERLTKTCQKLKQEVA